MMAWLELGQLDFDLPTHSATPKPERGPGQEAPPMVEAPPAGPAVERTGGPLDVNHEVPSPLGPRQRRTRFSQRCLDRGEPLVAVHPDDPGVTSHAYVRRVLDAPRKIVGHVRAQIVAAAVQEGAAAYLKRQYMTIGIVGAVLFVVLLLAIDALTGVANRPVFMDFTAVCLYEADAADGKDSAPGRLTVSSVGSKSSRLARELGMTPGARVPVDRSSLSQCVRGKVIYEASQSTGFGLETRPASLALMTEDRGDGGWRPAGRALRGGALRPRHLARRRRGVVVPRLGAGARRG